MRREAQEVLTGIWVGPSEAGKNLEQLRNAGIGAIVVLRAPSEAVFIKPRFPDQFEYLIVDIHERADQNLISLFPKFREFVDQHRSQGHKILIHDDGGMSRAPAMAAMYLIDKRSLGFEQALTVIQLRRYCMHLNQGFLRQLKEFEAMCLARDQHKQHQLNAPAADSDVVRAPRRQREEDDDQPQTLFDHTASDGTFSDVRQQKRGREAPDEQEMQE